MIENNINDPEIGSKPQITKVCDAESRQNPQKKKIVKLWRMWSSFKTKCNSASLNTLPKLKIRRCVAALPLESEECCPPRRVSDNCEPHGTLDDSQQHNTGKFDAMVGQWSACDSSSKILMSSVGRLSVAGGELLSLRVEVSWADHVQAGGFLSCLFNFILPPPHPPFLPIFYAIYLFPPAPQVKVVHRMQGVDKLLAGLTIDLTITSREPGIA